MIAIGWADICTNLPVAKWTEKRVKGNLHGRQTQRALLFIANIWPAFNSIHLRSFVFFSFILFCYTFFSHFVLFSIFACLRLGNYFLCSLPKKKKEEMYRFCSTIWRAYVWIEIFYKRMKIELFVWNGKIWRKPDSYIRQKKNKPRKYVRLRIIIDINAESRLHVKKDE